MQLRAYGFLCGVTGVLFVVLGLGAYSLFFRYHAPGGIEFVLPMGPNGFYFVGLAGTGLVAWGGCLLGAWRRPGLSRSIGTATALGCVMAALQRILAWLVGDYALLGSVPRVEAAFLLLLALAFVWLRPPLPPAGGPA